MQKKQVINLIETVHINGYIDENCYFYIDEKTKHGFLIDPGSEAQKILSIINQNDWIIEKILLTHGHFDHIGAVNKIRNELSCQICAHKNCDMYLSDPKMNLSRFYGEDIIISNVENHLSNADKIMLKSNANCFLKVIYTPGHTPDSITFYNPNENIAFVGDTIFKASIGTCQFPGGNENQIWDSIINRIFTLPDNTILYPGHSDKTTVFSEKIRYQSMNKFS